MNERRGGAGRYFGKNLRTIRIHHGLTQEELAHHLEVSRQQIYRYERGEIKEPSATILQRTAELTNIPIEKLISGELKEEDFPDVVIK